MVKPSLREDAQKVELKPLFLVDSAKLKTLQ